ncbi:MAG: alanine--tRNA ligase [Chlamydiota bacterium]
MLSQEIRTKFLTYFKTKGHAIVPSSPTLPHDDPTLLFTNAGMNQFKDVFLGTTKRTYDKATTAQKCIRVGGKHNDLDNVGHTSRHMTFFEMLGNFSFGAYSKKEAIAYAWEVSTTIFQFDPDKIWASVFETDDESFELWRAWLPEKRIVRFGESENFWTMGETGPCGPCSELLFDRGDVFGSAKTPLEDSSGERYIEFWNLVFMEFERHQGGKRVPLPSIAVDTGAGLERIVSLMLEVPTVFQTDILLYLIQAVEKRAKIAYQPSDKKYAPAFHVIADHVRSLSFAIADGAQPGNTEQGYVLRKILRRAVRYGRLLGIQEPFLATLVPKLIEVMGADYQEIKEAETRIIEILTLEEENFDRTLRRGGNILATIIKRAQQSGTKQMSGADAFKLKDTYGFPLEEILLIAKDAGMTVNLDAYQILESQAKEKSRAAGKPNYQRPDVAIDFDAFIAHHDKTHFVGYESTSIEGTITGILIGDVWAETMTSGQEGMIFLDQTPFYAEKGGQVSDTGSFAHHNAHFEVAACKHPHPDLIAHIGTLTNGTLMVGEPVHATVNAEQRSAIARHHTATHLLHWALEQLLGSHIRQAGSLVAADRLRFDFTHHKALSHELLRQIERLINQKIRENSLVITKEQSLEAVQKEGNIKQFFGDKYGETVRVVAIGTYSKELCGGTHVSRAGSIGLFRIIKEGSIGQGIRRIEAVTGEHAEQFSYHFEDQLLQIATRLKANLATVTGAVEGKIAETEELALRLTTMRRDQLREFAKRLASGSKKIGPLLIITASAVVDRKELATLADLIFEEVSVDVICLAMSELDKCQLFLKLSAKALQLGLQANTLVKAIAPCVQGSGGGKKETAQAGGKNPQGIDDAFKKVAILLSEALSTR